MLYRRLLILVALILCAVGGAYARTYYLPDYQSQFMYGDRTTETPNHSSNRPKCESYGYYSSMPSGYQCSRAPSPIHGMKCYSCTPCSSSYKYDSSSCSGDYVLSGSSCGGLYNKCLCNRSKFPAEDDSDCPAGEKIDVNQSCTNKSDGKTYYKCVSDPCSSLPSKSQCEADGGHCVVSSDCSGKCDECIEYCEWKEQEGAVRCENGCQTNHVIPECPDLCEAGGCKPTSCDEGYVLSGDECVPNPCDGFTKTECPSYATCSSCQSGDEIKYKVSHCKLGYALTSNGEDCVEALCPTGYATVATDCRSIANGTSVLGSTSKGQSGDKKCMQCVAKCNSGYELNSAGTACESIACDTGYVLVGSECEPDPCNGYNLTSCPAHAECGTCQSGEDTKYQISGCDVGYELNSAKTACEPAVCKIGYATEVSACGSLTNGGYSLDSEIDGYSGDKPCKKCAAWCKIGYALDSSGKNCEPAACWDGYVTDVSACGTIANGYYELGTGIYGYSGDKPCRTCYLQCDDGYEPNSDRTACEQVACPAGFAVTVAECGAAPTGGEWILVGTERCKECVANCFPGFVTSVDQCGSRPAHGSWSLYGTGVCRRCTVACDYGFTSCPSYVSPGSCSEDKCLPENVCEYRARELGLPTSSTSNGISGSHMFVSSSCYCGTSRPGEYCGGSTGGGRACLRMTTTYEGNTYICSLDMATGANFGKCKGYNKMSMSGVTTLEQFARNVGTATSVTLFTAEASQQGILTGNICLETY